MRLLVKWIPKEDEKVDIAFRNSRADLLITAKWTTLQLGDRNPQFLLEDPTGRASRKQVVLSEEYLVVFHLGDQVGLLVIVSDERDSFSNEERWFRFHNQAPSDCGEWLAHCSRSRRK